MTRNLEVISRINAVMSLGENGSTAPWKQEAGAIRLLVRDAGVHAAEGKWVAHAYNDPGNGNVGCAHLVEVEPEHG